MTIIMSELSAAEQNKLNNEKDINTVHSTIY